MYLYPCFGGRGTFAKPPFKNHPMASLKKQLQANKNQNLGMLHVSLLDCEAKAKENLSDFAFVFS